MSISAAGAACGLGLLIAGVHSSYARRYGLDAFYAGEPGGAAKRRIIQLIWHLPSLTWAALGIAVATARLLNAASPVLSLVAFSIFAVSGAGNLWAHRRPFIGGLLLLAVAGLVATDWLINS